jgi:hypothetical protein
LTFDTVVPLSPRKLICVAGEASLVPGKGETAIAFAAAAVLFAAGTEVGSGRFAAGAVPHPASASVVARAVAPEATRATKCRRCGFG